MFCDQSILFNLPRARRTSDNNLSRSYNRHGAVPDRCCASPSLTASQSEYSMIARSFSFASNQDADSHSFRISASSERDALRQSKYYLWHLFLCITVLPGPSEIVGNPSNSFSVFSSREQIAQPARQSSADKSLTKQPVDSPASLIISLSTFSLRINMRTSIKSLLSLLAHTFFIPLILTTATMSSSFKRSSLHLIVPFSPLSERTPGLMRDSSTLVLVMTSFVDLMRERSCTLRVAKSSKYAPFRCVPYWT